ncbi:MAG: hypothetical protein A2622_03630 [Bdellovibrionales bacterium RIFCSPHIGHO2_01_FULL_40_29]|nr:MAG: hypothetical protein A2622_03630 [Bdellovibrionales bacterium RIFCSPHIGHO2_01_FULL_40_29]OFZ35389.1 MAG: hypothetical protein A3D17_08400 [Bdellovibrionales bacterium RIFCSPHIGHO2_02_FULL_40_15]
MKISFIFSLLIFSSQGQAADISELCLSEFENTLNFSHQITERPSRELTVISWNAHKYGDRNYFTDLKKLSADADVLMIQEAMHSTGWEKAFASHMPFSFTFFESFCDKDKQATGVQNGARYKLENNVNLVSPDTEPVSFTPKVSGVSRIDIPGEGSVLLINTHAMNFNTGKKFERQIDQVANYIASQNGRVIWAGDFNTWNASRKKYLDQKTQELGLIHVKPSDDDRSLILDHIYVRGFQVIRAEILDYKTSDHRPLRAMLKFQ